MWNYLESFKNHFLQAEVKNLKSESINELVSKEFAKTQEKRNICHIAYPQIPECLHSTYFDDRADLAYGWYALPKLIRELDSEKGKTQWRAVNSISEYILNPLHAQTAIRLEMVRKAHNLFLRLRYRFDNAPLNESRQLLVIFKLLTIHLNGAQQVAQREFLLKEFYIIIYNREEHHPLAAKILQNLTEKPEVLQTLLNESAAFQHLTDIYKKDPCVAYYPTELWIHLSHFLEVAPEIGITAGFFELLYQRILGRLPQFHLLNMKCFALLLRCEEGQRRFDEVDGINLLYRIFLNSRVLTYQYVALALTNGLISKRSLWRCREFTDFPGTLLRFARKPANPHLQLYCLKAIRMMCEMPCIKQFVCHNVLPGIRKINCLNELNECTRDDLVDFLNRKIYESSSVL